MEPSDRRPLHNIEAEQSLLGAILINNAVFAHVAEFLRAEHFYDAVHQKIFAAIVELAGDEKIADPVTLKAYFERNGGLGGIGGSAYIAKLALSVKTTINAVSEAQMICDLYARRQGREDESVLQPVEQAQTDLSNHTLLHNIEAEQSLLGAVLIDNKILRDIEDFLQPVHFHDWAHLRIFAAIISLVEGYETADPVTLKAYFERNGGLGEIGGSAYIAKLALRVTSMTDARSNALIIQHLYVARQMSELGSAISRGAGKQDKALLWPIKGVQNDLWQLRESIAP